MLMRKKMLVYLSNARWCRDVALALIIWTLRIERNQMIVQEEAKMIECLWDKAVDIIGELGEVRRKNN